MAKSDGLERWKPAQSSAINRAVYNRALQRLAVEYKGGKRYTYDKVSPGKFAALKRASSPGKWINTRLKPTAGPVRKVQAVKGALRKAMTTSRGSGSNSLGGRSDG